jgi:5'-nucleotidase (lipoprotein e(P4) family)
MKKLIFAVVIFAACKTSQPITAVPGVPPSNTTINGKLFTSLFQQKAAEYRALCFQGYNIAKLRIDSYVALSTRPKAIITDVDETILDNSPYAVHQGLLGKDYEPESWFEWTSKGIADTMPGAAAMLKYAASKGIEIFYVTNREEREKQATLINMRRFGLPNTDDAHFLAKQTSSAKEPRRQQVMATHEIILLMGDNLSDFSHLYDKKSTEERRKQTDAFMHEFGSRFIVFPNPNYGDWETSLWNYKYTFTAAQKDSIIRANLVGY